MKQAQQQLEVPTTGRGMIDVTAAVDAVVRGSGVSAGQCLVFCRHTSASLVIQENASPDAAADLLAWLERIAPDGDPHYTHVAEGPDDMPAHLRSAVTHTSETIPVVDGRLALGTWQGLFLLEHRTSGSRRRLLVHVSGA